MKITYFVHDLGDAAVERRVTLFIWGGGTPVLLGFHRASTAPAHVSSVEPHALGRTESGKLLKRIGSIAMACLNGKTLSTYINDADVVVARNLEMLLLAWSLRRSFPAPPPLVYECLDIHSVMLGKGLFGHALRALERFLLKSVNSVTVSSPAFRDRYFFDRQHFDGRINLIENKTLENGEEPRAHLKPPEAPPWVIGWFGIIRCRKSLAILKHLVRQIPNVRVLIAGKPAQDQFDDFEGEIAGYPQIQYDGPYKLSDLPKLYAKTHFTWAIDYFEEGHNSKWLLPNRLYEGGICGSLPIAQAGLETARWLDARAAGVILNSPEDDLPRFFLSLDLEKYEAMRANTLAIPTADLVFTHQDAVTIVTELTHG